MKYINSYKLFESQNIDESLITVLISDASLSFCESYNLKLNIQWGKTDYDRFETDSTISMLRHELDKMRYDLEKLRIKIEYGSQVCVDIDSLDHQEVLRSKYEESIRIVKKYSHTIKVMDSYPFKYAEVQFMSNGSDLEIYRDGIESDFNDTRDFVEKYLHTNGYGIKVKSDKITKESYTIRMYIIFK